MWGQNETLLVLPPLRRIINRCPLAARPTRLPIPRFNEINKARLHPNGTCSQTSNGTRKIRAFAQLGQPLPTNAERASYLLGSNQFGKRRLLNPAILLSGGHDLHRYPIAHFHVQLVEHALELRLSTRQRIRSGLCLHGHGDGYTIFRTDGHGSAILCKPVDEIAHDIRDLIVSVSDRLAQFSIKRNRPLRHRPLLHIHDNKLHPSQKGLYSTYGHNIWASNIS
jgi:hypothetical protein